MTVHRMPDFLPERITRYALERVVHRGALSMVLRARDVDLDRPVAIKIIAPELHGDIDARKRFLTEAKATARVRHANIIEVFDVGEHEGLPYIVMEWIDGVTLANLMATKSPLSLPRCIDILTQLGAALDFAHGKGLVHRDIKPSNVLVGSHDRVTLTDFGLARVADRRRITHVGTQLGTPAYMSPEQVRGETAGPAADRYGFAVLAFELLTGHLPFDHAEPFAMMSAHVSTPVPQASHYRPGLPRQIDRVFRQGLAKDPVVRPQSATEFVAQLSAALDDTGGGWTGWTAIRNRVASALRAWAAGVRVRATESPSPRRAAIGRVGTLLGAFPQSPLAVAIAAALLVVGGVITVNSGWWRHVVASDGRMGKAATVRTTPPSEWTSRDGLHDNHSQPSPAAGIQAPRKGPTVRPGHWGFDFGFSFQWPPGSRPPTPSRTPLPTRTPSPTSIARHSTATRELEPFAIASDTPDRRQTVTPRRLPPTETVTRPSSAPIPTSTIQSPSTPNRERGSASPPGQVPPTEEPRSPKPKPPTDEPPPKPPPPTGAPNDPPPRATEDRPPRPEPPIEPPPKDP